MLFFPNAEIIVPSMSSCKNSEGSVIRKFDFEEPLESFRADVQPNSLSSAQIELYGINSRNANTKKCFSDLKDGSFITAGCRIKVIFDDGENGFFTAQPANKWRTHREFLLISVENEQK